jgi:hypothetical protein
MDPLVLDKCGFAAEGFPTFPALIRLFSTMDPLVLDKSVFAAECFPAFTALKMHLSNMKGFSILSVLLSLLPTVGDLWLVMAHSGLAVLLLHLTLKGLL